MQWHLWERPLPASMQVLLKRYTDQVILTYDSDGAGVKAALACHSYIKRGRDFCQSVEYEAIQGSG